jgi:hypothetical protein
VPPRQRRAFGLHLDFGGEVEGAAEQTVAFISMPAALLDTDILSEVLKQRNAAVQQKATAYLQQHGPFTLLQMSVHGHKNRFTMHAQRH